MTKGGAIFAERIRQAVAELAIPHSASETVEYFTVSLGVVTVAAVVLAAPEQVVELADKALYAAQKGGRNCCEVWGKEGVAKIRETSTTSFVTGKTDIPLGHPATGQGTF